MPIIFQRKFLTILVLHQSSWCLLWAKFKCNISSCGKKEEKTKKNNEIFQNVKKSDQPLLSRVVFSFSRFMINTPLSFHKVFYYDSWCVCINSFMLERTSLENNSELWPTWKLCCQTLEQHRNSNRHIASSSVCLLSSTLHSHANCAKENLRWMQAA